MSKPSVGQQYNYWTLLEHVNPKGQWRAKCICGKIKLVWLSHLRLGKSTSCSCMGKGTHNMAGTPIYQSWSGAKGRCTNPSNQRYSSYGGRGITMCKEWLDSFETFYKDMGDRPEGLTLERIDVDGNYEPANCKWASHKEQANNLRIHKAKGYSIPKLAAEHGIPNSRLATRLKRGWTLEAALNPNSLTVEGQFAYGQITTLKRTNTSGVRGVHWSKSKYKWVVQLRVAGKTKSYGAYNTLQEATDVVNKARKDLAATYL